MKFGEALKKRTSGGVATADPARPSFGEALKRKETAPTATPMGRAVSAAASAVASPTVAQRFAEYARKRQAERDAKKGG